MVKYRLKKCYPNSPKLGTEVQRDYFGQYVTNKVEIFQKKEIEDYPEFWEEIKEKEYEIVMEDGTKSYPYPILAVKRLSDGEIFSINDTIQLDSYKVKISKISLEERDEENTHSRVVPYLECGKGFGVALKYAKKAKSLLFITEDGKKAFEGDIIYEVNDFKLSKNSCSVGNNIDFGVLKTKGILYFSTKEAAEKYIDENKPKYSLKQAASFIQQFDLEINQYEENSLEDYMRMIKLEYDKT